MGNAMWTGAHPLEDMDPKGEMSFMGIIIWIAIFIKLILDLVLYTDDSFSFNIEGIILWYEPYKCYCPVKQAKLLTLLDEISLPYEKAKQEYGPELRITYFLVDPNEIRVTMIKSSSSNMLLILCRQHLVE
jgi:hypothetical protein